MHLRFQRSLQVYDVGTGLLHFGWEVKTLSGNKTLCISRIVLCRLSTSGVGTCLRFLSWIQVFDVCAWSIRCLGRAQSARLWKVNCITGLESRGFLRRAQHAQLDCWMQTCSSHTHARAGGIGKAISAFRNVAATCAIDTLRGFLGGVIGGGSLRS